MQSYLTISEDANSIIEDWTGGFYGKVNGKEDAELKEDRKRI
jgi:hypothetical protein